MINRLWKDFVYSWRSLRKNPLFVFAAILPLAAGLGASAAIFSLSESILLHPLPFPQIDRIVYLEAHTSSRPSVRAFVTPADYLDWGGQTASWFESLAAYDTHGESAAGVDRPEAVEVSSVTPIFFSLLGITPAQGRLFIDSQERNTVILSYNYWQRRFGAKTSVLGTTLLLDGVPHTIVGILLRGTEFPSSSDVWCPLLFTPADAADRVNHRLEVIGRLRAGRTVGEAQAGISALARRAADAYPDTNRGWSVHVQPLADFVGSGPTGNYLVLMIGAVLFVLLIVCFNVANLQFVRGVTRRQEWSIRYALGGTRAQVVRLLLIESVALSLASTTLAFWLAFLSLYLIRTNMPSDIARYIPGFNNIGLNGKAFFFTLFLAVLAGVASGILPALFSSLTNINGQLKQGGRVNSADRAQRRLSMYFLVSEIAIALALLVGTGLMIRGMHSLMETPTQMHPEQVLVARLRLSQQRYPRSPERVRFYESVQERLSAVPGVSSVSISTSIPLGDSVFSWPYEIEGAAPLLPSEAKYARMQSVNPEFSHSIHLPLVRGRTFRSTDGEAAPRVAMVSRAFAKQVWGDQDPIGHRIRVGIPLSDAPWTSVVGVVEDVRYSWMEKTMPLVVYRPMAQAGTHSAHIMVRTQGDPLKYAAIVRDRISTVDSQQSIAQLETWSQIIHETLIGPSYVYMMMLVLGVVALLLTSVGIYSLLSYTVETRATEMGIRITLGAQQSQIVGIILGQGLRIVGAGLLLGSLVALWLTRGLAGLVFGVHALDLTSFLAAVSIVGLVGLLASYFPALQACRVDVPKVMRE